MHIGFSALLNSRFWGLLFFVFFAVFFYHTFLTAVLLNNSASVEFTTLCVMLSLNTII